MIGKKNILVCPLDWGLGHATRCVPIIRMLIANGQQVIIAADKLPLAFLKKEFPDLQFIVFPGYEITYPQGGNMIFKMLFSIPKLYFKIKEEHRFLEELVVNYKVDGVISDNRYGLWSKKVKTVFITHQLRIKAPFFENFLFTINKYFIKKFNYCWIPDFKDKVNLSGALSHGSNLPKNLSYIGSLSRFKQQDNCLVNNFEYDVLFLISGPEPQRSIFEKIILSQIENSDLKTIVVLGKTNEKKSVKIGQSLVFSHLETPELSEIITKSKVVVSRSGYSTIMDMAVFGKRCIFVPTPGQTEQEYLANYFHSKGKAYAVSQSAFNLNLAIQESLAVNPLFVKGDDLFLEMEIKKFVSDLNS